jgi:hypothetical protein
VRLSVPVTASWSQLVARLHGVGARALVVARVGLRDQLARQRCKERLIRHDTLLRKLPAQRRSCHLYCDKRASLPGRTPDCAISLLLLEKIFIGALPQKLRPGDMRDKNIVYYNR